MMRKLLLLAAFALLSTRISAQAADEIVSKYVAARGGAGKIKAVKTERIIGTISFGPDAEGPFLVERLRPLKMHMEITLNGQTLIRTYDGKSSGWIYNPFSPKPEVQAMTENDLKGIFDEADFDGPFVDYKAKGNQIEFVDKGDVQGKPAYKLKLTNKNNDVSYFYFDADTYLILKWEGARKVADHDVPWESIFHDFRDVEGVKYPFLIESDSPGTEQTQRITADKIEVNVPIDQSHFGKPKPPTPPAPADPPKSE